jgi:hypothetical protein
MGLYTTMDSVSAHLESDSGGILGMAAGAGKWGVMGVMPTGPAAGG